jgi:unspecific monooxygenase
VRDRRFGREVPAELAPTRPAPTAPFYALEANSMLELEPPRHTRLRGLVLRAFTSRRVAGMEGEISALCQMLLDRCSGTFDLIDSLARPLPVIVVARLLGVPEAMAGQLLAWSNAMVAMYQARRTVGIEIAAATAAAEFAEFLRSYVEERRKHPADDLITLLIAAEAEGERLTTDELIATCVLLLNAGHEATVHSLGNAVKALIEARVPAAALAPEAIAATVEEALRFDPPLHLFTRFAYETVELAGHSFQRGERIGCLLAAANRDPEVWDAPDRFDPGRPVRPHVGFGAGIHFCVGTPLARLELQVALPALFARFPGLRIAEPPRYADLYHFHGLERLMVRG